MTPSVYRRLRCLFGHDYQPDRAVDREEGGYTRHHKDGTTEPLPACYVVRQCSRCESEKRIYSSVSIAKTFGVPLEWEQSSEDGGSE